MPTNTNKMLIDATHPEETRVVVLRGGRVEEFDYESSSRKPLRGNIYLAKVTRVEPALQAAFVDYGGNRHGFLAFNEIHPDYYQIPVADRQALLEEEAAAEAEENAQDDHEAEVATSHLRELGGDLPSDDDARDFGQSQEERDFPASPSSDRDHATGADIHADDEASAAPSASQFLGLSAESQERGARASRRDSADDDDAPQNSLDDTQEQDARAAVGEPDFERDIGDDIGPDGANGETAPPVEQVGSEDALEELPSRPRRRPRSYKIQEVIKRRQVILIQVVKEERGNKGAALTTYLSLAGRYTVLMPNTARGGGISRKISSPQDRKRLKAIASDLDVGEGMGLIIRTAGASRTEQEVKRDFEYLLRLWENVRDLTLQSTAPCLVYEEGNLIKRSIRDLYNKDIDEIIVAGGEAHAEAHDFMRMLMPSHAKHVVSYEEPEPLFARYQIERQLSAMFSPYVYLKSGGYLVINQTEALVAVDVNSGKSTREFSIEETALNTNLEAADEIARQLKLRDLAGLIVVDFIDMEEKRNNRSVERRMKDALRFDRARIQVGHISHFGLLEMSRQRLRTGVLEGSTSQCPHCQGTGIIRSTESVALAVLRGIEDAVMAGTKTSLIATTTPTVALYILNSKRTFINDTEARHGFAITVQGSDKVQGANFTIEKGATPVSAARQADRTAVTMNWGFSDAADSEPEALDRDDSRVEPEGPERAATEGNGQGAAEGGRRRRGRRRRGGSQRETWVDATEPRSGPEDEEKIWEGQGGSFAETPRPGEGRTFDATADDPDGDEFRETGLGAETPEDASDTFDSDPQDPEGLVRRARRRGRRGGRRGRERTEPLRAESATESDQPWISADDTAPFLREAPRVPSEKRITPEKDGFVVRVAIGEPSFEDAFPKEHSLVAPLVPLPSFDVMDTPAREDVRPEFLAIETTALDGGPQTAESATPAEDASATRTPRSGRRGRAVAGATAEGKARLEQAVIGPETKTPADAPLPPHISGPQDLATPDLAMPLAEREQQDQEKSIRKGWWQRRIGT